MSHHAAPITVSNMMKESEQEGAAASTRRRVAYARAYAPGVAEARERACAPCACRPSSRQRVGCCYAYNRRVPYSTTMLRMRSVCARRGKAGVGAGRQAQRGEAGVVAARKV